MKKVMCYIFGCYGYVNYFNEPKPNTFSQICLRCGTKHEYKIPPAPGKN